MASRRVRPRTIAAYSTNSRAYPVGLASPILSEPLIDVRQHRLAECEVDLAIFLCNCVSARPADIQRLHSGVASSPACEGILRPPCPNCCTSAREYCDQQCANNRNHALDERGGLSSPNCLASCARPACPTRVTVTAPIAPAIAPAMSDSPAPAIAAPDSGSRYDARAELNRHLAARRRRELVGNEFAQCRSEHPGRPRVPWKAIHVPSRRSHPK
jgi:hypothetical protein